MASTTMQTVARLNSLIRLTEASERGFVTAAEHVKNRGLKILLKNYAEQRAQFSEELRDLVVQLGGKVTERANLWGTLHRGWIDIMATLTIGRMNQARVVLQECLRGEQLVLHRYLATVKEGQPATVTALLEAHVAQIRATDAHLSGIVAHHPNVLLVQLYERADSVQTAVNNLLTAGIAATAIQVTPIDQMRRYSRNYHRQLMFESTVASALMGMVAGVLLALMTSVPLMMSGMIGEIGGYQVPLWSGALIGIAGGVIFGLLIGQGIGEDDAHFYQTGLSNGSAVVTVRAANAPAKEAHQILEMYRNQERQADYVMAGITA